VEGAAPLQTTRNHRCGGYQGLRDDLKWSDRRKPFWVPPIFFRLPHIHDANTVATNTLATWTAMKTNASPGAIPAKVSESERAMVTAGLANDVEAVNQ
jgi:hypothetical protein